MEIVCAGLFCRNGRGGDDDEIRQRINEVIRSGNKELLTALADTLHDALLA